jgi:hypothetical protein
MESLSTSREGWSGREDLNFRPQRADVDNIAQM